MVSKDRVSSSLWSLVFRYWIFFNDMISSYTVTITTQIIYDIDQATQDVKSGT